MVFLLIGWWIAAAILVGIDLWRRFRGARPGAASLWIWGFAVALVAFSVFWFTGASDL